MTATEPLTRRQTRILQIIAEQEYRIPFLNLKHKTGLGHKDLAYALGRLRRDQLIVKLDTDCWIATFLGRSTLEKLEFE